MALIDLNTNLRSLKFGLGQASDKPGGGYSNQPYIVKPIPDYDDDGSNIFNTGGPDSLLRGGLMAPIKSINDVSRLTQMFFDLKSPNGLLFTVKQNVLSRTSVKTEASQGAGTARGTINQGVYLPTSTILQAGVGFTGTHLNLLGLNPASPGNNNDSLSGQTSAGGLVKYETAVKPNPLNFVPDDNRLIQLTNEKLGFVADASEEEGGFFSRLASKIGIGGPLDPVLREYSGGPGATLGIGDTKIFFADQRTGVANPLSTNNEGYFYVGGTKNNSYSADLPKYKIGALENSPTNLSNNPQFKGMTLGVSRTYNDLISKSKASNFNNSIITNENFNDKGYFFSVYDSIIPENTWPTVTPLQSSNNSVTWTQDMLISQPINDGKISGNPSIQDFRKPLLDGKESSTIMSLAPDYTNPNVSIEGRVGLGNPGSAKNVYTYLLTEPGMDLINSRPFYSGTSPDHGTVNGNDDNFGNDLCKFTIGLLKNDGSGTSNFIQFRAYIDDFSDAYSADWGEVQYVGRGDKFYNYKGFNRSINMGWTVHASSKGELIPMYKKLNYLASGLAPDYSAAGFMKGNLARLTVGGYLYNQLGIIKSITYTIPQESTWEIGVNQFADGGFDNTVKELPHMIKVTGFEFIPIQYDVTRKGATKFIQLQANSGTNWSRGMQMPDEQASAVARQEQVNEASAAQAKKDEAAKQAKAKEGAVALNTFMKSVDPFYIPDLTVKSDNTRVVGPVIFP